MAGRCAACKYLRRKCSEDCVLAPYFPANNPHRFSAAHKIFGASNIAKLLQQVPEESRMEAADCMALEAYHRIEDPVYGCVKWIYQLQQQIIETQSHTTQINAQIAYYNNYAHLNQQQHPFSSSSASYDRSPPFTDFDV